MEKSIWEHNHESLSFQLDLFITTQVSWSKFKYEVFSLIAAINKLHCILACPISYDLFTDHNILLYLFDPLTFVPDLTKVTMRKVSPWAVHIPLYNF